MKEKIIDIFNNKVDEVLGFGEESEEIKQAFADGKISIEEVLHSIRENIIDWVEGEKQAG